jgi:DNA-binding winged helix-turn-helix (wHTH) protein
MPSHDQGLYGFAPFRLDPGRRVLTRGGVAVALTPKVFDTLLYLVENPDRLIGKDEILGAIWAGRIVEEGNISQTVFTLRKALDGAAARFIATVPGRGYSFHAVRRRTCGSRAAPSAHD